MAFILLIMYKNQYQKNLCDVMVTDPSAKTILFFKNECEP